MNLDVLLNELLDHARGMWRFRWHAVIVAWLVAIPGWLFVYKMPDIYEASAKVMVDTNSLLPSLTAGLAANENLIDEVSLISRALLTRPNLAEVARKTDREQTFTLALDRSALSASEDRHRTSREHRRARRDSQKDN